MGSLMQTEYAAKYMESGQTHHPQGHLHMQNPFGSKIHGISPPHSNHELIYMIACIDCDLSSKVALELSFLDTARSVVIQ